MVKNLISPWVYVGCAALAAAFFALVATLPHTQALNGALWIWGGGLAVMSAVAFRRFNTFHHPQDAAWALLFAVGGVLLLGGAAVFTHTTFVIAA